MEPLPSRTATRLEGSSMLHHTAMRIERKTSFSKKHHILWRRKIRAGNGEVRLCGLTKMSWRNTRIVLSHTLTCSDFRLVTRYIS